MPAKPSLSSLQEKANAYAQKAKEMQAKIKELENDRYLAIGREVAKYHNKNFEGFDQAKFQSFVNKALAS